VQRTAKIVDQRHLESDLFKTDPRLDAAFHNDPTLTAADNGSSVARTRQALDAALGPMPKSRRTTPTGTVSWDGQWGSETSQWGRDFQSAHHIPPGGFEASRRTLDALDADAKRRQLPTLKPIPPPAPKDRKVCGSNVSNLVQKTWTQIQKDYEGFSLGTRVNACRMLVQPLIIKGGKVRLNQDAFDTIGLFQGSMAWSHGKPYAEACGVPAPATYDPDDPFNPIYEDPYGCSNTVQIGSTCWLSGTPNYGTFGIMMRLCYDDIGMQLLLGLGGVSREAVFGLATTIALAGV
jgi:hypothetical protein